VSTDERTLASPGYALMLLGWRGRYGGDAEVGVPVAMPIGYWLLRRGRELRV
jgi:hypothetical protein